MNSVERAQVASSVAVITLCGVVAACAIAAVRSLDRTMAQADAALVTVNRSCAPGPCGTLAAFTKAVTKGGDAIATTQMQEQQITPHVIAAMDSLETIAPHADETLDAVSGTVGSAVGSLRLITGEMAPVLDSANTAVRDLDTTAKGVQPDEAAMQRSMEDFDALLRSPEVPATLEDAQRVTHNLAATTTDFQQKFHVFLFPAPCRSLGCKLRRTWPYIRGAAQMVEPLYWGQQLVEDRMP
ncbi:MAG: hypothetical protein ACP5E5_07790 [Acidobacteriaceae bacterium]